MTKRIARRAPELLTEAEYKTRLEAQGGVCAVPSCGRAPKTRRLSVDHDHATGKVRGLLCHRCNRWIAAWVTVLWLGGVIEYLVQHERETAE